MSKVDLPSLTDEELKMLVDKTGKCQTEGCEVAPNNFFVDGDRPKIKILICEKCVLNIFHMIGVPESYLTADYKNGK